MKRLSLTFKIIACSAAVASLPLLAQTVETPVAPIQTEGGLLAGKVLASGVKAWLGVPFAKPPTQALRWQAPQPMTWRGVWNADRLMPECIQVLRPHNINHYFGEEPTSENCLYMNIWAPGNVTENSNLPVIVFIYGGGSTIGSSGMANYDGANVARHGAVFVNFNYRVGLLGFMAHPELTKEQGGHSGNYAYLDQNAALKWIKNNIRKFGGDPSKVLISGQSAGAGSVTQQIFSPLSKGLFSSALMSSGCSWGGNSTSLAEGEKVGTEAQQRLGVANLDEMRQVPADKILGLQAESQVGVSTQGLRVGGVIDGYFMPKTQMEILAAHEINDVPIIAHFNQDEASNALMNAKTVAEYRETATRMYGDKTEAFLKLYPVTSDADIRRVAGTVARESGLERNARNCAVLQSKYNKSAAYISTYARKHPYTPGVKLADQDTATIGAYHTADVPYWFGTLDSLNLFRPTRNWTAWDRELSDKMMNTLITFAKTGSPATAEVKWPAWNTNNEQKVLFSDQISVVKLNINGIDFLTTNLAQPVPVMDAPRVGPRD
jgi:para-nitrobenzyl esterase